LITITKREFKQLADYIHTHYGIHLKEEKQALVTGRLQNVLLDLNCKNFTEYHNYVISDKSGKAASLLINKITTNHTFFMRESDHFDYFRNQVLPYLKNSVKDKDLRIWSAGCSSGEEPYTLAMIIDDYFGSEKNLWDTKVLATDISLNVLEQAIKGIYTNEDISVLPALWRNKYFNKIDHMNSTITDKLKNEVIFRKFNLMEEIFPFRKKFHTIFCRNVMIYFDLQTKRDLVNTFYDSLEYGGYLFIGHSEALNRDESRFKYVMPSVYRKE
jgi:chemotaxis protein methyltransferase CheR